MKSLSTLGLVLIVSTLIFSCFGAAPVRAESAGTYIVQPGDTLIGIAARYGVSVSQLARANGLRWNSWVYVGQRLSIPGTQASPDALYIVRRGDTLFGLARRFGTTVQAIMAANNLRSTTIYVGQQLLIPGRDYVPARPTVMISPTSGTSGMLVRVVASGFPPNTPVSVGLGPVNSEFSEVARGTTDASGRFTAQVPVRGATGQNWIFGISAGGAHATSDLFLITAGTPLAIHNFEIVELQDTDSGKRITFSWSASGVSARIVSGTRQRLQKWWGVPLSGTRTVEVRGTTYRNPEFTLEVCDSPVCYSGDESIQMISESVQIEWACELDYFFTPAPRRCPLRPATYSWAAEQRFEHGRMIWLEDNDAIHVFYEDGAEYYPEHYPDWQGRFERFEDTWTPDETESDPTVVPPEGLYQPIRGFGKVWRENPQVREQLGWATAPEQGYESALQYEHHEGSSSGANQYLRTVDNQVIWYFGAYVGPWGFVTS